jgi:hypothetical protein
MTAIGTSKQNSLEITKVTNAFSNLLHFVKSAHQAKYCLNLDIKLTKLTARGRIKLLKRMLNLGAKFNDQESIEEIIAQQEWTESRKVDAVDAYDNLL